MTRRRRLPCHPKLDAILANYWTPEGASIKSIMAQGARGTTSPTALRQCDVLAETFDLIVGLTADEVNEIRLYYMWRAKGDELTAKATEARQEARKRAKRRKFKAGMKEIQRKWEEKRPR